LAGFFFVEKQTPCERILSEMNQNHIEPDELNLIRQYSRQYEYSVRGTETDTRDELQSFALLSMLQEAASLDAEYSGLGASVLDPAGYCWLLLRTSVRLAKIPEWQDRIIVDTWTNGVERLFSIRDFLLTSGSGQFYGKATSSWLVVDKATHRPQKITVLHAPDVMVASVSSLGFNAPKLEESLVKLPAFPVLSNYAGYSEMDRNHHVNNTRYAAWCLDAVGVAGIPAANLIGLDINYISEVRIGETIDLFLAELPVAQGFCPNAEAARFIVGKHREDQKTAFISILYWDSPL